MKEVRMHRGSALLIVLGMLAFMIVSAVAFSAYMRYARLPSSYLRRSSSSRHLAKAALARAIDFVDASIGNNPHPGVGTMPYSYPRYGGSSVNRNHWLHRVFIGGTNSSSSAQNNLIGENETVSTLSLEALAYVPPPLVNEARYYSRRSLTGRWQAMGFDSGRYAFCCLDVSDYFDVNRLRADGARLSASNARISLSYLFEDDAHQGPGDASSWETFMEEFRTYNQETGEIEYGSKLPLTSVADLNLAMDTASFGRFKSPFVQYVRSGGGASGFYNCGMTGGDAETYRRMTFVTDSWFPTPEPTSQAGQQGQGQQTSDFPFDYDLGEEKYQPFKMASMANPRMPLMSIIDPSQIGNSEPVNRLFESICGLGLAALYDYLDYDRVPCSLAIPTCERVPMVCGFQTHMEGAKFSVTKQEGDLADPNGGQPATQGAQRTVEKTVTYKIAAQDLATGIMGGEVKAVVAYPFAHQDGINDNFELDGRVAMFLSSGAQKLRTGNPNDVLHFGIDPNKGAADLQNGVLSIPLPKQQLSFNPRQFENEEDALKEVNLRMSANAGRAATLLNGAEGTLLTVKYRWIQTKQDEGGFGGKWEPEDPEPKDLVEAKCGFTPLKEDGTADGDFQGALMQTIQGAGKEVALNLAVWLRVKDSSSRTVDLVPACIKDDDDLNMVSNYRMMGPVGNTMCGRPYPLMRLSTGIRFTLSLAGLDALADGGAAQDVQLSPETLVVADPRYNHAPEHWFRLGGQLTKQAWLGACRADGQNGRDRDIFMATSDQGYLQSIYELAFLPRLTNLAGHGARKESGDFHNPDDGRVEFADSFEKTVNSEFMWRTYDPFGNNDDFEGMGFTSAGTGFKVNPYSDSTNVLMAAFANTPLDWRLASTNNQEQSLETLTAQEYNRQYAWNEYGADTHLAWTDLEQLAAKFSWEVRQSGNQGWRHAWRQLDFKGDENTFCDIALDSKTDNLWSADRKFLYGYWHDCFDVKQQLLLFFVRAEPMMMGGGAAGQMPPQLGARAVALVWRDPQVTREDNWPHRTRILFYRQLD